ncbi:MAG TPA: GNAT family N-acetyltransferase [Streptosporangiaceae bacterium]|nr:GNAT family N-acetyltransferase [Streptosporangiaceae bacterium]
MTASSTRLPRRSSRSVVRADTADLDVLSRVIADAFCDLAPSQWRVPALEARRRVLPGYFRLCLADALAHGIVCTTPSRTAAALWLPIGAEGPVTDPGYGPRLAAAAGPFAQRFESFDEVLGRHHPTGTGHHHLAILAVRPDRQGQGIGSALLRAHHATLDQAGTPVYLEASDLHTRRFYLTCGYTDHGPPIHLPDGPLMYPLWRHKPLALAE